MALSFNDALFLSVFVGVFFGLLMGVRYLVKIESHQKKVLDRVLKLEELIVNAEKNIISKLSKTKK